jgi:gliding motility-associated-like protein
MLLPLLKRLTAVAAVMMALPAAAQLNVTTQTDPLVLAQKILGSGVRILNPQFKGHNLSAGTFTAAPGTFVIDSGIVLTTGRAKTSGSSVGVDGLASAFASSPTSNLGDADLTAFSGKTTKDACILEFDFIPQGDSINIRYVFGSEEYPEWVCSQFNDVFGFFISGPGFFGQRNIANVPNAPNTTPVSINTINSGIPGQNFNIMDCQGFPGSPFTQYYVNNSIGVTMTYDGHTVVLTAKAKVTPCQTYHIKLAIADATDQSFDSGVFIEANSFSSPKVASSTASGPYTDPSNNNAVTMIEACKQAEITLTRSPDIIGAFTLVPTYSGTATVGTDYTALPATINFAANENVKTFTISALADVLNEGTERALIRFSKNTCTTQFMDSVTLFIKDSLIYRSKTDTSFCTATPLSLTAHNPEANVTNTYTWSNGGNTQTTNITQPGTYTVVHTYSQRCLNVDTFNVVSKDPSFTNTSPNLQFCSGDSVTLSVNTSANSLLWNTGATGNSIKVGAAGKYWVRASNAAGCVVSDTMNVTQKSSPYKYLGADTALCQGNSVTFDASYPGATYLWGNGATTPTINVSTAGSYSVITTLDGCTAKDTINVTINPPPTVNLGNDTTICQGSSVQLNAASQNASYLWNTGATTSTLNVNTTGKYWVTSTIGSCSAADTINVNVDPVPVVDLGNDTTICEGNTVPLNAAYPGATYSWSTGSTASSISVNSTALYKVTLVLGQCSAKDSINVTVSPLPVVNLGNDTTICQGNSVQLNATYAGATHLWNTGATTSSINVNSSGNYSVTNTLNGCTATDAINVTVNPNPVVNLGNDTSFCQGTSVVLDATYPGATYVWSTGATSATISVNASGTYTVSSTLNGCTAADSKNITVKPLPTVSLGADISVCQMLQLNAAVAGATSYTYLWNTGATTNTLDVTATGTYWVTTTDDGCSKSDTINVAITPAPVLDLGPDQFICEYDSVQLAAFYPGASYTWSNGATSSAIVVSKADKYWATASLNGCSVTDTVTVIYKKMPVANAGNNIILPQNASTQLNATQHSNNAAYLWSPALGLSNPTIPNPIASPDIATQYYLTVTSVDGCVLKDTLRVDLQYPLNIANAFSPNGDGINDKWLIGNAEFYPGLKVRIFNRYGQQVFNSIGYNTPWDGSNKGKPAEPATYYYIIETGDGHKLSGWVLLLR